MINNEKKSTHKAPVVELLPEKHPNADRLGIARVNGDYTVVINLQDWAGQTKAIYVQPDTVVNTTLAPFSFLSDGKTQYKRIKAKKIRNIVSMGLLIKAPENAQIGDDYWEELKLQRYENTEALESGDQEAAPSGFFSKYDIDALLAYARIAFVDNEPVYIQEKLNGENSMYMYKEGRMWARSRNGFKKETALCTWWQVLNKTPSIAAFCKENQDCMLFGEIYGHVGGYYYGLGRNLRFGAFDIQRNNMWLDSQEQLDLFRKYDIPHCPVIATDFPYNLEKLKELCQGQSLIQGSMNIREGIVVTPVKERWHPKVGRVKLKLVNPEY